MSYMKKRHRIAVRTLVDYALRSGDLDMRFAAPGRPQEGIRAHQRVQRQRPEGYRAEVAVSTEIETAGLTLVIGGRIDGVLETETGILVEEIKSTTRDLTHFKERPDLCHWGQAKVYAFLLAEENTLDEISVQLTYVHLDSGETLELVESFSYGLLKAFFQDLVERYLHWASMLSDWRRLRDESLTGLDFPFKGYRPGQRHMAVAVYRTLRDGRQALVQASTGIGKTMAALFPALKTIGEGHIERIFFLTARNTGKQAGLSALDLLEKKGGRIKRVCLTAKEQICFSPEGSCTPDACEYARGHFDRLAGALHAAFALDNLEREAIEAMARDHRVCPFEFSLELALWADCILCDYNYAFDPRVYLRRFFDEESGAYAFLVDEAHNLVDRSREMFSARLCKADFLELRRAVKDRLPSVHGAAGKLAAWMRKAAKRPLGADGFGADPTPPEGIAQLLHGFAKSAERWLAKNEPAPFRELLLERYFEINGFLRVLDGFDDSYVTCYQAKGRDVTLKLFCMDPSRQLKAALARALATVFFSATLTPADYFETVLGCEDQPLKCSIPSPFPAERLKVLVADRVSTAYSKRAQGAGQIARLILSFVCSKKGNYLCFFPSYEYMAMAVEQFEPMAGELPIIVQERKMDEDQRRRFLERFRARGDRPLVGFAVMGGIFGEGIDLVGERLSGAVIVSVGLPGICPQRDLIRAYFDKWGRGFDYAYRFPGITRVLQAAGRVIRSEHDHGAILLVDSRFGRRDYSALLPSHWDMQRIGSIRQLEECLRHFWPADGCRSIEARTTEK